MDSLRDCPPQAAVHGLQWHQGRCAKSGFPEFHTGRWFDNNPIFLPTRSNDGIRPRKHPHHHHQLLRCHRTHHQSGWRLKSHSIRIIQPDLGFCSPSTDDPYFPGSEDYSGRHACGGRDCPRRGTTGTMAPTLRKDFSPSTIPVNGVSTIIFTINNPNGSTVLTGVAFSDYYPTGLVTRNPLVTTNSCGGTLQASAGGNNISLSGASLAGYGECTLTVVVTAGIDGKLYQHERADHFGSGRRREQQPPQP